MQSLITISVQDVYQEIDFSKVKKYFLVGNNEDNRISVSSKIIDYPSLRKRCKLQDDIVYIKLDTDDVNVLCDIAILCSGISAVNRIANTLSFISSICDDALRHKFTLAHDNIDITDCDTYESPKDKDNEIDDIIPNQYEVPIFEENLTVDQLHELEVNYLLLCSDRSKHALSHPNLYSCQLDILTLALIKLANEETYFINSGKGRMTLFTNEYENLPGLRLSHADESPYKLGIRDTDIISEKSPVFTPIKYNSAVYGIKLMISGLALEIRKFLSEGYGVLFGTSINGILFCTDQAWELNICLKDKSMLDSTLKLFESHTIKQRSPGKILLEIGHRHVIVHIPQVSHIHYISCQPYSCDRMFYDNNNIYMTATCMLSLVNNNYITIIPKYSDITRLRKLLAVGFSFSNEDLKLVPGYSNFGWDNYKVERSSRCADFHHYKGIDAHGYISALFTVGDI